MEQLKPRQVDSRGRLTLSGALAGSWVTVEKVSEDEYRVKRTKIVEADSSHEHQAMVADTDQVLTVKQMAEAFDQLGTPTADEEAELSVDPDDSPLF